MSNLVSTKMGDRWVTMCGHPGYISLLPTVGWEISTNQSVVMFRPQLGSKYKFKSEIVACSTAGLIHL